MKVEEIINKIQMKIKKYDREMELSISVPLYLNASSKKSELEELLRDLESLDKGVDNEN